MSTHFNDCTGPDCSWRLISFCPQPPGAHRLRCAGGQGWSCCQSAATRLQRSIRRRRPSRPRPRRIDLLRILQRHPRRLPSAGLGDGRQVDIELREILRGSDPCRVSTDLGYEPRRHTDPLRHPLKDWRDATPGCKASPIWSRPISRRNTGPSVISACSLSHLTVSRERYAILPCPSLPFRVSLSPTDQHLAGAVRMQI